MSKISRATVLAFVLLSLGLVTFVLRFPGPYFTLQRWGSDHISHVSTPLMFREHGFDIYRKPPRELLTSSPRSAELVKAHKWDPHGVFVRENDPTQLPLYLNWPDVMRAYPPGDSVLHIPVALLYSERVLDFEGAARFSIFTYAVASLLAVFFIFQTWFFWGDDKKSKLGLALKLFVSVAVSFQLMRWAFEGLFDGVAVLFLLFSFWQYARARWVSCVAFYAVAVFLHLRCLWYAPLPFAALLQLYQQRKHMVLRRADLLSLAFSAVLAGGAAVTLFLLLTHFTPQNWHVKSPVYFSSPTFSAAIFMRFTAVSIATLAIFAVKRLWLPVFVTLTTYVMFLNIAQMYPWHSLFMIPLVFYCGMRSRAALVAGFSFYVTSASWLFENRVFDKAALEAFISYLF